MKEEHTASRTLVKSTPELWAECSVAASLTRHLGQFGEIKITRLEPETAIAWEGEHASGTVRLEPSGWGTQVTLTARATKAEAVSAPEVAVEEVLEQEQAQDQVVEEPGAPGGRARSPSPTRLDSSDSGWTKNYRGNGLAGTQADSGTKMNLDGCRALITGASAGIG